MIINTADLGFEKDLMAVANKMRGTMDASEYKHVFLGLIFLKYVSDSFEQKYDELVEEGAGFEEERDEYIAENIFFVPEEVRWSFISKHSNDPEIGVIIDEAMVAIEKENDRLRGILPKTFARPELDKRRLGETIDIFTNIKLAEGQDEKDVLGRTYEYAIAQFAEQEGRQAGEFYTPSSIVRTIVEILEPYNGRVYDPACGAGGMFVQSANFVRNHQGNIHDLSVYGQEANPTTWKLAQMNLAIHGIEADLGEAHADTFHDNQHPRLRADYIMANPPFNISDWGGDKLSDDKRWNYGTPPNGNANFAWLQHMIYHLSPKGKIGLVLANGSLSSQTGNEGEIRKNILEADLVETIIALPTALFYSTGIPVSLWFLNKDKKQKEKTLFIDARNMGEMVTRAHRDLSKKDIMKLAQTHKDFVNGELEEIAGFSAIADLDEIKKNDYILTPGRYVGMEEVEDDGIPFEEKMNTLTGELSELFLEDNKLEDEIRRKMQVIGYDI